MDTSISSLIADGYYIVGTVILVSFVVLFFNIIKAIPTKWSALSTVFTLEEKPKDIYKTMNV